MLSIKEAVSAILERGESKYQVANNLDTSTTLISKYQDGRIRNVGLKMAVRIWDVYQIQIMPYSLEDLSGINRKKEQDV